MTLGIDVSRLFPEMCLACSTSDLVQKKMIYLYLSTYSETNPDLVLITINAFRKDCQHVDPKIRGLALRNLCSLRAQGVSEYFVPAILDGLKDFDPYVKKTAIMGCIKLYYTEPDTVLKGNIVEILY